MTLKTRLLGRLAAGKQPRPSDQARYRRAADAIAEEVDGELLLVQLSRGTTFRLNATGRAIWDLAIQGIAARELAAQLAPSLGAPADRITADAVALLAELLECGLIEPRGDTE